MPQSFSYVPSFSAYTVWPGKEALSWCSDAPILLVELRSTLFWPPPPVLTSLVPATRSLVTTPLSLYCTSLAHLRAQLDDFAQIAQTLASHSISWLIQRPYFANNFFVIVDEYPKGLFCFFSSVFPPLRNVPPYLFLSLLSFFWTFFHAFKEGLFGFTVNPPLHHQFTLYPGLRAGPYVSLRFPFLP